MSDNKLAKVHSDIAAAQDLGSFISILNQEPPKGWVKVNKFANNSKYIPIERIEMMMDQIFQKWRVEVIDYKHIINSLAVQVRIHYWHPVSNEWTYHDGLGAVPIEMKKDAKDRADINQVNVMAIQKNLPAAKSYAIRNAITHIGQILGRDLNRDVAVNYQNPYPEDPAEAPEVDPEIVQMITSFKKTEDLMEWAIDQIELQKNPNFTKLIDEQNQILESDGKN